MLYNVFFVVASFVFISALIIDLDSPSSAVASSRTRIFYDRLTTTERFSKARVRLRNVNIIMITADY